MDIPEVRLFKEPGESFIFYHETNKFCHWHNHPEYELTLITRGSGIRMIGDHVDRFKNNDLILTGPYLPHEWKCDESYLSPSGDFTGECLVIQFPQNFL